MNEGKEGEGGKYVVYWDTFAQLYLYAMPQHIQKSFMGFCSWKAAEYLQL